MQMLNVVSYAEFLHICTLYTTIIYRLFWSIEKNKPIHIIQVTKDEKNNYRNKDLEINKDTVFDYKYIVIIVFL